jgi:hypothetical protein
MDEQRTFKADPSILEPVVFSNGSMSVHPQFVSMNSFKAVLADLKGDRDKLYDVLLYLAFVHSPSSVYKQVAEIERISLMLTQQNIGDKDFVRSLDKRDSVKQLVSDYLSVMSTPAARLQEALMTNVARFIDELSGMSVTATNMEDVAQMVNVGINLNEQLKKIKSMLNEERVAKMRGNYNPALFESDRDSALRIASKVRS